VKTSTWLKELTVTKEVFQQGITASAVLLQQSALHTDCLLATFLLVLMYQTGPLFYHTHYLSGYIMN